MCAVFLDYGVIWLWKCEGWNKQTWKTVIACEFQTDIVNCADASPLSSGIGHYDDCSTTASHSPAQPSKPRSPHH